ncbi:hypothetical protein WN943_029418 [Citrus x changshan-huyou]
MTFSRASLITSLSVTESLSLMSPPCALLPPISIAFRLLHPSSCYRQKLFALDPHRRRQNVDARFRFSSFHDQDLCSINFTTTRRSPSNASSPDVPAQTDKSEYAGCSPGANPPTLKSDMKVQGTLATVFRSFPDGMGLPLLCYGQTWDLACYATVQGKAWLSWLCETLRVTPRFWGKRGCHGSVRSCVLRQGSGESVAEIGLANDNIVDEQDNSALVLPRTRLLRNTPVRRTPPSDICSSFPVSSTCLSQTAHCDVHEPNSTTTQTFLAAAYGGFPLPTTLHNSNKPSSDHHASPLQPLSRLKILSHDSYRSAPNATSDVVLGSSHPPRLRPLNPTTRNPNTMPRASYAPVFGPCHHP